MSSKDIKGFNTLSGLMAIHNPMQTSFYKKTLHSTFKSLPMSETVTYWFYLKAAVVMCPVCVLNKS